MYRENKELRLKMKILAALSITHFDSTYLEKRQKNRGVYYYFILQPQFSRPERRNIQCIRSIAVDRENFFLCKVMESNTHILENLHDENVL